MEKFSFCGRQRGLYVTLTPFLQSLLQLDVRKKINFQFFSLNSLSICTVEFEKIGIKCI
jgi:hypothetical protein